MVYGESIHVSNAECLCIARHFSWNSISLHSVDFCFCFNLFRLWSFSFVIIGISLCVCACAVCCALWTDKLQSTASQVDCDSTFTIIILYTHQNENGNEKLRTACVTLHPFINHKWLKNLLSATDTQHKNDAGRVGSRAHAENGV